MLLNVAPTVAALVSALANDAMTRNHERDRIAPNGRAYGTRRAGLANTCANFRNGQLRHANEAYDSRFLVGLEKAIERTCESNF